jgi:hypothetical protein
MQELLFGTWGPQIVTYSQQNPWRVFAMVLMTVLLLDLLFRKQSSGAGDSSDFGGLDFGGDSDGDSGGD